MIIFIKNKGVKFFIKNYRGAIIKIIYIIRALVNFLLCPTDTAAKIIIDDNFYKK